MQSREFGWGMTLTEEQLKEINVKRARDVGYCDEVASKDVMGTTKKADLTESPFIRKLEYGSNKEGYWTGNHMIVQFEDCIDCLKVVYGEEYDFVFLFDHSSGHAKKRLNGLDSSRMNKTHGGIKQHATPIKEEAGYLGKYHDPENANMVRVGEKQDLNWEGDLGPDAGPWYLSPTDRLLQRDDQLIPLPPKKLTSNELITNILMKDAEGSMGNRAKLVGKDMKTLRK